MWSLQVATRNGGASGSQRSRQLRSPPQTRSLPRALSLLLVNPRAESLLCDLDTVTLDEWHELVDSKRGVQCELCLSWLRHSVYPAVDLGGQRRDRKPVRGRTSCLMPWDKGWRLWSSPALQNGGLRPPAFFT